MKRGNCRKTLLLVLTWIVCVLTTFAAVAEGFDVSAYSYDELLSVRDAVNERIAEIERQYAIENGNRKIFFEEEQIVVIKGRTKQLSPNVKRVVEEAPEKTSFVYASSDAEIAKVSSKGVVTGVKTGQAMITCSASDDELIFCEIPVVVGEPVASVAIEEEKLALLLKENDPAAAQADLVAVVGPENAYYEKVVWKSSDEKVATVDADGHVQAVAPGSATITATSEEPPAKEKKPKSDSCKVTVGQAVEEIQLSETEVVMNKGKQKKLKATITPENATTKSVKWSSSDAAIVSITKEGSMTAKACGTATILCEAADGSGVSASCEVTVIQMVTSLTPESKKLTLNREGEMQANVKVSPADATEQTLAWTSSNPEIVTVSESGMLYGAGGGSATITCTATDGSEKTASFSVFVPSIAVEQTSYTVTKKEGLEIKVDFYGKPGAFSASSSSAKIVKVKQEKDEEGRITVSLLPQKYGTATVSLKDANEEASTVKLTVNVAHSAVFDSVSYPKGSYDAILRNPDAHMYENISISGRVLQKLQSGSTVVLRVATKRYDDVFYVRYSTDEIDISILEDDRITVYGYCLGDYTYETIFGASVTIPDMRAEKIVFNTSK